MRWARGLRSFAKAPNLVAASPHDSSYCSANDRRVHFGLNGKTAIRAIEVAWPDGSKEQLGAPAANRVMNLVQGTGIAVDNSSLIDTPQLCRVRNRIVGFRGDSI